MDKNGEMSERREAREAIVAAFRDTILERGMEGFRVQDLARRAGVARSTFYEHFKSREDLLFEALRIPLAPLVQLAWGHPDPPRVIEMLEHFRQAGSFTQDTLDAGFGLQVRDLLAEMIAHDSATGYAIAGAQLSLISAWLGGKLPASASEMAASLERITCSLLSIGRTRR